MSLDFTVEGEKSENKVIDKSNSSSKDLSVQVRFNKSLIFTVNRQRLIEKSLYFKLMRKPCYNDHKSDYLEVSFTVQNNDVFEKVIKFVTIGTIELDNENLFDIISLAAYLQVDSLQKPCLDHFTYNLNKLNVDSHLELLKSCMFAENFYEERAMTLKVRGLPSFSGLYFLKSKRHCETNLKMITEETKSVQQVSCLDNDICDPLGIVWHYVKDLLVHRLQDSLIIYFLSDDSNFFLQYNIITGKTQLAIPVSNSQAVSCTSDKHLFVIRPFKNEPNKTLLSLSVYEEDEKQKIKSCKENVLSLIKGEKASRFSDVNLRFVEYSEGKIYLFYSAVCETEHLTNERHLYILTICAKTLTYVKNTKLNLFRERKEIYQVRYVKKLFYMNEEKKVYMSFYYTDAKDNDHDAVLVYDFKTEKCYFTDDLRPIRDAFDHKNSKQYGCAYSYSMNKDMLYVVCSKRKLDEFPYTTERWFKMWTEVKSFRYENENFVEAGLNWESGTERRNHCDWNRVFSAVFV